MATSSDRAANAETRHILVVEDDEACVEAYGKVLRGAGYKVSLARDFRLALEILEAAQPLDLLLVDIVMPGSVNGVALSRMARMRRKNLKVLYVTGYHIPGVSQEALGPILLKPLDDERLLHEVSSILADTATAR
jgi:DNA-binding NtrC family response regulator